MQTIKLRKKTMEDHAHRKVKLKGYLELQKTMPKGSWPRVNMWRFGSENVLVNVSLYIKISCYDEIFHATMKSFRIF